MTSNPASGAANDAQGLRDALRAGLTTAMKARDADAVTALRTAIAAIENAEAVPTSGQALAADSAHVAGARSGAGSTEAARRHLSPAEVRDILRAQVSERVREADGYDELGQRAAAERLRRQARTLAAHLD